MRNHTTTFTIANPVCKPLPEPDTEPCAFPVYRPVSYANTLPLSISNCLLIAFPLANHNISRMRKSTKQRQDKDACQIL